MNRQRLTVLLTLAALTWNPAPVAGSGTTCIEHRIVLSIQPAAHTARIEDRGLLIRREGWNLLYLKADAEISIFTLGDSPAEYTFIPDGDTTRLPAELRAAYRELELTRPFGLLTFESSTADTVSFHISFTAVFDDPVEGAQFSREKVGSEVSGTILEQGAYLSPRAGYYLQGAESLARYSLEADIPEVWEAVADGNPGAGEVKGNRKRVRFENPFAADGMVFMAAPYVVSTVPVGEITVATYFFEADTSLSERYLTASADYIRMYQELIGPYPFDQFTVAENFFPTGYGMPGWTLLGQRVIRLPFIITSSLGHEVLHNWWGNSVYVDYDRGNWCEAAAVYGADYRYKLLSSPEEARDYRKNILKEYLSYVHDGNDFPLREFTSRSSPETRTIGYNKGMMVFHLIEQQIGTGPFFAAWQQVYRDYLGQAISWEEWIDAFEQTAALDLGYVIPEWIDRTGAPQLGLEIVSVEPAESGDEKHVRLRITQSPDTLYHLMVPLQADGPGVSQSTTVELAGAEAVVEFSAPAAVTTVSLDPDYHIFRRLYPEEVEPIVATVMGVAAKRMVCFEAESAAREALAAFGSALAEDTADVLSGNQLQEVPHADAPVLLNPTTLPDALAAQITVTGDSLSVGGESYPRVGHTLVMAGQNWNGFDKYMVILTRDYGSLPRLGQLVPHYGKYSYLVFSGSKNVAKGQWPVTDSPLRISLP